MAEGWAHSLLHQDTVVELPEAENVLGRSRHCQITIADPSVSRKHVLLKPGPGHIVVRDLGSSNGTFVNDRKVVSEDVVEDGDTLRVGDAEMRVRITGPQAAEPAPADDPIPAGAPAETIRLPVPPTPTGATAIPQMGEATTFLQAESMKLAALALGEDSPVGEPQTEAMPPVGAATQHIATIPPTPDPPPPEPAAPGPPIGAQTQRLDSLPDLQHAPPEQPPAAPPIGAQTQRLDSLSDFQQAPAQQPPAAPPIGAQTQRLDSLPDFQQAPPQQPPAAPPIGAQTQRLDSLSEFQQAPPQQPPDAPPIGAQTQRLDSLPDFQQAPAEPPPAQEQPAAQEQPTAQAPLEPPAPPPVSAEPPPPPIQAPPVPEDAPPEANLPLQTQRIQIPQQQAPPPPESPESTPDEPPAVQAFGGGPTSLEIPQPPEVPDIDVSSEQSIVGMAAIPIPMPDVEGEAPEVPDIDLASEQSIVGMPAIAMPMPDVEGDAPEVPDIDLASEQSIVGMAAIPMPVAGDEGHFVQPPSIAPPVAPPPTPPAAPEPEPEPVAEAAPEPAPSADAAPDFSFDPGDAPSFELDATPDVDFGMDAPPSFEADSPPSFELDEPAVPDVATDAETDEAARSVSTVPLDDDEDIRSLVQPLSDEPDDFSGFTLDLDASGVGGAPAAVSMPAPTSFGDPPPTPETPAAPPATAEPPPAAMEPRFDVPVPPATPPPKGPDDPPAPDFAPPSFEPSDLEVAEFAPPDFDPPDFEPPGFEAPDLEPAEFLDPAALPADSFDQPTPAAAPPPAADDLDFPMRQPTADLLPSLDDMTASVVPPEARPPEPVYESSGAFAHTATQQTPTMVDSQLAGFWIRAASSLLDAILVSSLTAGAFMLTQNHQLISGGISAACFLAFYLGWVFAGRSPGKIALGLVIEDVEGNARLGFLRAAIRAAGVLLSCLTLGFGFLMVLFRDDRRALHDRIAGTWVRRG